MRKAVLGVLSATLLFSVGCTEQPKTGTGAPPASPAAIASAAPASAPPQTAPSGAPQASTSGVPETPASGAPAASGAPEAGASSAPVALAVEVTEAANKLQEETGIAFAVPPGLQAEVRDDGEIQLVEGEKLFIAVKGAEDLDSGMKEAVDHLNKVDKGVGKPEVKEDEKEGIKAKMAVGKISMPKGKEKVELDYMILVFAKEGPAMRVVLLGTDVMGNPLAKAFVESVKAAKK